VAEKLYGQFNFWQQIMTMRDRQKVRKRVLLLFMWDTSDICLRQEDSNGERLNGFLLPMASQMIEIILKTDIRFMTHQKFILTNPRKIFHLLTTL